MGDIDWLPPARAPRGRTRVCAQGGALTTGPHRRAREPPFCRRRGRGCKRSAHWRKPGLRGVAAPHWPRRGHPSLAERFPCRRPSSFPRQASGRLPVWGGLRNGAARSPHRPSPIAFTSSFWSLTLQWNLTVTPKPIENPSPVGSPCWGPRAGTRSGQQVRGGAWTSVKKAGDASSHSFPGASKGPNPLQDPKFHDSPRPPAWLALALALWGRVCSARAGTAPTATRGAGGSRRGHRSELAGRTACPWSRQGSAQGAPRSGHVLYGRPLTCRL